MSNEAKNICAWINSKNMKSGHYIDMGVFNIWCVSNYNVGAGKFIDAMDELVALGYLEDRNPPGQEKVWDYWVA